MSGMISGYGNGTPAVHGALGTAPCLSQNTARHLSDTQIAWLDGSEEHWRGRARTRREAAEDLRREGHIMEADHCLKVASEYEQKAAEVAKGTN